MSSIAQYPLNVLILSVNAEWMKQIYLNAFATAVQCPYIYRQLNDFLFVQVDVVWNFWKGHLLQKSSMYLIVSGYTSAYKRIFSIDFWPTKGREMKWSSVMWKLCHECIQVPNGDAHLKMKTNLGRRSGIDVYPQRSKSHNIIEKWNFFFDFTIFRGGRNRSIV